MQDSHCQEETKTGNFKSRGTSLKNIRNISRLYTVHTHRPRISDIPIEFVPKFDTDRSATRSGALEHDCVSCKHACIRANGVWKLRESMLHGHGLQIGSAIRDPHSKGSFSASSNDD